MNKLSEIERRYAQELGGAWQQAMGTLMAEERLDRMPSSWKATSTFLTQLKAQAARHDELADNIDDQCAGPLSQIRANARKRTDEQRASLKDMDAVLQGRNDAVTKVVSS